MFAKQIAPMLTLYLLFCSSARTEAPMFSSGIQPTTALITEKAEYSVERYAGVLRLRIIARYTNRTDREFFIARCGEAGPRFYLERLVSGSWIQSYQPLCVLVEAPPFVLPPSASRTDTIDVIEIPDAFERHGQRIEGSGTYRLVYGVFAKFDEASHQFTGLLSLQDRSSNEFSVRK